MKVGEAAMLPLKRGRHIAHLSQRHRIAPQS